MDTLKENYKKNNHINIDIDKTENYNLDSIPDIYNLTNFNTSQTCIIKFIYSIKSLQTTKMFKYILVNDTLINNKYYISSSRYNNFDITTFLKNIKKEIKLNINIDTNKSSNYNLYIKTNTKDCITITTNNEHSKIYNMNYLKQIFIDFFELCFDRTLFFSNINDNDVFIEIYLKENKNNEALKNKMYIYSCSYNYFTDKFLNCINNSSYYFLYKIRIHNHELSITEKCIKSFSLQIYNNNNILKNIFIRLDLYCLDNEYLYFYISKFINIETNEIINLLPNNICNKCKLIPTNIITNNMFKKDMICKHIIIQLINNIKQILNLNSLDLCIKYEDLNKIINKIIINKKLNYSIDNYNNEIKIYNFVKSLFKDY